MKGSSESQGGGRREADELTADASLSRELEDIELQLLRESVDRVVRENLSEQVIAEHRASPIAWHSLSLDAVLNAMRLAGGRIVPRYVLTYTPTLGAFQVGRVPIGKDPSAMVVADGGHATVEAAEHDVFLRRLRDLGFADASGAEA